jgi:CheY-like chemotaxis protein
MSVVNEPRTFLIVDDDEDARFLTRRALEKAFAGAAVIESETADEALGSAAGRRLDGIITDHHLGDADGVTLVRELRARGVHCPIVMVTLSSDPRVPRRAYEAGAAHVFTSRDNDLVAFLRTSLGPGSE